MLRVLPLLFSLALAMFEEPPGIPEPPGLLGPPYLPGQPSPVAFILAPVDSVDQFQVSPCPSGLPFRGYCSEVPCDGRFECIEAPLDGITTLVCCPKPDEVWTCPAGQTATSNKFCNSTLDCPEGDCIKLVPSGRSNDNEGSSESTDDSEGYLGICCSGKDVAPLLVEECPEGQQPARRAPCGFGWEICPDDSVCTTKNDLFGRCCQDSNILAEVKIESSPYFGPYFHPYRRYGPYFPRWHPRHRFHHHGHFDHGHRGRDHFDGRRGDHSREEFDGRRDGDRRRGDSNDPNGRRDSGRGSEDSDGRRDGDRRRGDSSDGRGDFDGRRDGDRRRGESNDGRDGFDSRGGSGRGRGDSNDGRGSFDGRRDGDRRRGGDFDGGRRGRERGDFN